MGPCVWLEKYEDDGIAGAERAVRIFLNGIATCLLLVLSIQYWTFVCRDWSKIKNDVKDSKTKGLHVSIAHCRYYRVIFSSLALFWGVINMIVQH